MADSVGSFHVCAYVDCNGNGAQDFNDPASGARIDREPFILLGVVLVRAQSFRNDSRAQPGNIIFTPPAPTSATGVRFQSGLFVSSTPGVPNQAVAAVHMNAVITLIGGGRGGQLGLDRVFAGWVNNITALDAATELVAPAAGASPAVTHREIRKFHENQISAAVPPLTLTFIPAAVPAPPGLVNSTTAAPIDTTFPILDTSPFGSEGTGGNTAVGTEGVQGGAIASAPAGVLALGARRRVQMFDSPGTSARTAHRVFPGALTSFKFNVDFRADLCLWTNMSAVATPTNDPACRLYVSVWFNRWNVRCRVTFNAAGAGTIADKDVTITPENTADHVRLATPITKPGVEVRFPVALRIFGNDART